MPENVAQLLRRLHREQHPDCTYGDQPHYVPPSLGQIGFYLCDVPEDLRNHARCAPPYDHEHAYHAPAAALTALTREEQPK